MPNFAKKIELDDTLKELFFSFLLNGKYQVPPLSQGQEKLISRISEQFLMSGFLLKSCIFSLSHKSLVEQIKRQRKLQFMKQMRTIKDLQQVARRLNEKGIEHVFLKGGALNSDGIYPSGIRFSRDIDLLVRLDLLDETYNVLKELGFRYLNPKTQDSTKYNHFGHHFPVMINETNTKLELHWRVTSSNDFKDCPLTEKMLDNRRASKTNPNIFCPKIEITIAHLIYHSIEQHRMNLGPIFLFDLATIFIFFGNKWPVDYDLLKKLGVEKKFELCKKFIERASNESSFSSESKLMLNKLFKNSQWLRLSDGSKTSSKLAKTTRIEIFDNRNVLSRLVFKFRYTRFMYQVSYYSPKFWLFFVSDILMFLKKVIRVYFN